MTKESGKGKKVKKVLFRVMLAGFFLTVFVIGSVFYGSDLLGISKQDFKIPDSLKTTRNAPSLNFIKAIVDTNDHNIEIIKVSDPDKMKLYFAVDKNAAGKVRHVFDGKRINIALTGVDARLGQRYKHADANHVLSVMPDSGRIEIISIPRDTPAEAGYPENSCQNKITIVRAKKGREEYLTQLAKIARVDKIHHFVEVGFSQAMGIIEWLGFKKSSSTLQVLRSRSSFKGDDYQRVYNQAQFIRQMMFVHSPKLEGLSGDLLVRGGLAMVESDLTSANIKDIFEELNKNGFNKSIANVSVKVQPSIKLRFQVYNFADRNVVKKMQNKVKKFFKKHHQVDSSTKTISKTYVYDKLSKAINKAIRDSAKHPTLVINGLRTYFGQNAWLQIKDIDIRDSIRYKFKVLLSKAYFQKKEIAKAQHVIDVIDAETALFKHGNLKTLNIDTNHVASKDQ